MTSQAGTPCDHAHLAELRNALAAFEPCVDVADDWGRRLAEVLE
jgi:D-sedoheptulose 7-phosphate isomerase